MTHQQMQNKIKNLKLRVALLEKEIGRLTGEADDGEALGRMPSRSKMVKIRYTRTPQKTLAIQALDEYRDYGPIMP